MPSNHAALCITFTGRVAAKQFVRNKPNPGVKVFLRCSSDGVAHDFEVHQGKGAGTSLDHKHLELGVLSKRKARMIWMTKEIEPSDTAFEPSDTAFDTVCDTVEEMLEPFEYFRRYFLESMFEEFARCTTVYMMQTADTILGTSLEKIKIFLIIL